MEKLTLTSNKLKVIAIITMIMDHIGYYFYYLLNDNIYLLCRIIGRISMPLFVFLLVEGYLHTKNYKKYVTKIALFAVITQIIIFIETYLNYKIYPNYIIDIGQNLNILFGFIFILLFLKCFDSVINKWNKYIAKIVSIFCMFIICILLIIGKIDYGIITLILAIIFYITKKYINDKLIYKISIVLLVLITALSLQQLHVYIILSIPFILLYNNKLGDKNKIIKNIYYYIFPMQHAIIYLIAMLVYYKR